MFEWYYCILSLMLSISSWKLGVIWSEWINKFLFSLVKCNYNICMSQNTFFLMVWPFVNLKIHSNAALKSFSFEYNKMRECLLPFQHQQYNPEVCWYLLWIFFIFYSMFLYLALTLRAAAVIPFSPPGSLNFNLTVSYTKPSSAI